MANCKPKKGNKFTLKDYTYFEELNEHTFNTINLVERFGTKTDIKTMVEIQKRHDSNGSLTQADYKKRYLLHNKYFKCFMS